MPHRLLDRLDWWWYRRRLWWASVRNSGYMLTRRVLVEQLLLDIAHGKHQPLTPNDCFLVAMYLGTTQGPFPRLHSQPIYRETAKG